MRILAFLLGLGLLAGPVAVSAADGDAIDAQAITRGPWERTSFYLCDSKVAANSSCAEFDLLSDGRKWPDMFMIELQADDDCSADPALTAYGTNLSGEGASSPASHNLMSTTTHGATTLTADGVSAPVFPLPTHRYVFAALADMTDCTDYDVVLHLWYDSRRP